MKQPLMLFLLAIGGGGILQAEEPLDSTAAKELNEIIVSGEKPQISARDGIMTVDLPAIVKDKPVTNVLEALKYLPGVTSDNGLLSLTGANGVTIILNGEVTNMPVQNLYQLLYSTPIDKLKNVEISYAAPAKYHVKGAVINVVLKTPRAIDGLTGQVQTGYTQAHYDSYNTAVAATYAISDWTFDLNWSINKSKAYNQQVTESNHLVNFTRHLIEDDMRQISDKLLNTIYASMSYKNFKVTYNGQITSSSKAKSLSSGTYGIYENNYRYNKPVNFHNVAALFKSKFGLQVGGDYTYYNETRSQKLNRESTPLIEATTSQHINKYHAYVDQEHSLGTWVINYGGDYQHSDDRSRQQYAQEELRGFNDNYTEDVANIYIALQHSFKWGLSFSASVTGEYFHNKAQNKINFTPQIGATYYKTPKNIFQLSFTSQRVYPSYWELHGGTSYINEYSMIMGNPSLQPYLNYSGQFSYIFKQKYVATIYALYSDDYSVQLPYQIPDDLRLLFQTLNLDYSRTIGLQVQAPFKAGQILSSTAVLNLFDKREKASRFHDISFDNHKTSLYASLKNTIRPTSSSPFALSVDISYISGGVQGNGRIGEMWKTDAGAKWQFGKNRCCEVVIMYNDIFNTWNPHLRIKDKTQNYDMKVFDSARNFNLSFVWRFNGFKPKSSSLDTSRYGTKQ